MPYPYWDTDNRYIVAGPDGRTATVQAQLFPHPSGYFQARCKGNRADCPEKLGPYFGPLALAQLAVQEHCSKAHYVTQPASLAAATSTPPAITPSKIIATHS